MSSAFIYYTSCSAAVNGIKFDTHMHNYESGTHSVHYTLTNSMNNIKHAVKCYLPKTTNTDHYSASSIVINNMKYNTSIHNYDILYNSINITNTIRDIPSDKVIYSYNVKCYLPKQTNNNEGVQKQEVQKQEVQKQEVQKQEVQNDEVKKEEIINMIKNSLDDIHETTGNNAKIKKIIKLFDYLMREEVVEFIKMYETFKNTVINKCFEFKRLHYNIEHLYNKCDEVLKKLGSAVRRSERIKRLPPSY
jgi:hypothetical protein